MTSTEVTNDPTGANAMEEPDEAFGSKRIRPTEDDEIEQEKKRARTDSLDEEAHVGGDEGKKSGEEADGRQRWLGKSWYRLLLSA